MRAGGYASTSSTGGMQSLGRRASEETQNNKIIISQFQTMIAIQKNKNAIVVNKIQMGFD